MTADPAALRLIAVRLAAEAAEFVRTRRATVDWGGSVRTKSTATDPVTVVDTECEQLLRRRLAALRPDDAILGEETGDTSGSSQVRWVLDPIDGTVNFLYGIPAYAVSVAAQVGGRSAAGAVADVAAGRLFSASLGGGASVREPDGIETALACNAVGSVGLALVATGFAYAPARRARQAEIVARLLPRVRDIRRIGSAALDLCAVAEGRVDAHYEHGLGAWDWAAGALIAAEAGAVVAVPGSDSPGTAGELTVAMAPGIAAELSAVLLEAGADRPIPAG